MVSIPTIKQIYTSVLADLQTEFGTPIDPIGKAFLRAYAAVQTAKLKLLYYGLGNVQKNIWPDLADPEALGGTLERFGRTKGLTQFPGSPGYYIASVSGSSGAIIGASTVYRSDDTSLSPAFQFVLDDAYTLIGSGDTITLRCLTVGTTALLAVGNTLTATKPIIGVAPQVTILSISTSPIDAETIEQYRVRILETYLLEPEGGAQADYRLWGREAAGVQQIYPYALTGQSNTVITYVEAILSDSIDGKGTPTPTILAEVTAIYAPANGLKPLAVFSVDVQPVVIETVDISIPGTTAAMTAANKTLITTALTQALAATRPFIPGADILSNINDIVSQNTIINTILTAVPGSIFTAPVLTVTAPGGSPTVVTSYTFDNGIIPYLNSVTFP